MNFRIVLLLAIVASIVACAFAADMTTPKMDMSKMSQRLRDRMQKMNQNARQNVQKSISDSRTRMSEAHRNMENKMAELEKRLGPQSMKVSS